MTEQRQELEELRRLDELERRAESKDLGEIRKAQERTNANIYAGEDIDNMGSMMRGLGGAKHSFDKAAYGLKGLFTDLSTDERAQIEQGKAFVNQGGGAATVGEIGGEIAMLAAPALRGAQALQVGSKMLPKAAQFIGRSLPSNMIAGGAASAALTPDNRVSAGVGGALGAGAGEVAGRVLTKTLGGLASSAVSPQAKRLMDQGVNVPMWKATDNKVFRDLADRVKALPVAGNILRGQERSAFEDFNKVMSANATPPMPILDDASNVLRWETKPVSEVGSDALNTLRSRFDDAYDALYKGRGIPLDRQYGNEVVEIVESTKAYFPRLADEIEAAARQSHDILAKASQEGHSTSSPEAVKQAIDSLETRISTAFRRGDMEAADALKSLKGSVEELRIRGLPPEVASQAGPINKAYASFKQLERATGGLGAQKAGMASPAQILNAIKSGDRSPGKSQFARGNALNQKNTLLADEVLGSRLPETGPGTAEKMMLVGGLGLPMVGMDAGASLLLGTKTGQRALMGRMPGQAGLRKYGNEYLVPALRALGMTENN